MGWLQARREIVAKNIQYDMGKIAKFFAAFTAERWAALGSIAAAISAALAYWQIETAISERMTPYRAVLYSAKVESYTKYAESGARYIAALHDAHSAIAFDVGADGALDQMPDSQMQLAARSVHFLLETKSEFFAVLKGTSAVWSPGVLPYIEQDNIRMVDASACFVDVGQRTGELVPVNWAIVRERAKISCPGVLNGARIMCFEWVHQITLDRMKREIALAELDLVPYAERSETRSSLSELPETPDLSGCPPLLRRSFDPPPIQHSPTAVTPDGRTVLR